MEQNTGIIDDIVQKEAFKVLKNDILKQLKQAHNADELSYALGLQKSFNDFIAENNYKRLGIIMKANDAETKTKEIEILLKYSNDLNEFILLVYLAREFKINNIITTMK